MASLSPAFLDELRQRLTLSSVVGRKVRLVRRGREHTGLCPFHNEKSPSFTVNDDKGFFHCFGCGAHGDVIGFVMRSDGLQFPEAVETLAAEAGMQLPKADPAERARAERAATLYDVLEAAAQWFTGQLDTQAGADAKRYLLDKRALRPDTARRFRLGYAPGGFTALKQAMLARGLTEAQLVAAGLVKQREDGGESFDYFRDRVMFPITDKRGRVIAFGGRALGDNPAKYLNSPETELFHKGANLYNLATAREAARA
ncbi:MAG: DNA primase, partial [Ferrovibrionaceae bacterium]